MASVVRCAIYTRKSSEEGLDQSFNSLDAQREACAAYITSQKHEGWIELPELYDDGGYSGGSMDRPALKRLLADVEARRVDVIVVYKVDRLTRSLSDFARIVEVFDAAGVSFVSVTQQFNTTTSMGRLTLNVLLSFAQFEREVTGERIRDKFAASRRKGIFMGGTVPLGYDLGDRRLLVNEAEAELVRTIFRLYLASGNIRTLRSALQRQGHRSRRGYLFRPGALRSILKNPVYIGKAVHKGAAFPGEHEAIIDDDLWIQVQERLSRNASAHRAGHRHKEPSLLAGLLYDPAGNRFTPSHAVKNGKRYRYYRCQALDREGALQFPAQDLEQAVTMSLDRFFADATAILKITEQAGSAAQCHSAINEARDLRRVWAQANPAPKRELLLGILQRVEVRDSTLCIHVDQCRLLGLILPNAGGDIDGAYILEVPLALRRVGLGVRLIVDAGDRERDGRNPSLVKAVARAYAWYRQLAEGALTDVRAIAAANGLPESYVGQILRLALLPPKDVEAILRGTSEPNLSVEALARTVPRRWASATVDAGKASA